MLYHVGPQGLCYSADGSLLACGTGTQAFILQADTYQQLKLISADMKIMTIALSPDNNKVVVGGTKNAALCFDIATNKPVAENTLQNQEGTMSFIEKVGFLPTNNRFFSLSTDGILRIFNWEEKSYTHSLKGCASTTCMSHDGSMAISAHSNYLKFIDVESGKSTRTINCKMVNPTSIASSSDGKQLAVGGTFKELLLFDVPNVPTQCTLASLLFLDFITQRKARGTLKQLPIDWDYLYLFALLPDSCREQFPALFDYDELARILEKEK